MKAQFLAYVLIATLLYLGSRAHAAVDENGNMVAAHDPCAPYTSVDEMGNTVTVDPSQPVTGISETGQTVTYIPCRVSQSNGSSGESNDTAAPQVQQQQQQQQSAGGLSTQGQLDQIVFDSNRLSALIDGLNVSGDIKQKLKFQLSSMNSARISGIVGGLTQRNQNSDPNVIRSNVQRYLNQRNRQLKAK